MVAEDQTQEAPHDVVPDTSSAVRAPAEDVSPYIGGPPRFPRRYVYLAAYAVLGLVFVLGIGIFLANRLGSPTGASTPSGTVRSPTSGTPSGAAPPSSTHALHAPLSQFLDISPLKGRAAKAFTLRNASTGAAVSLSSLSGHVVVLSFANAQCNDICPVLAAELHQAASRIGTTVPVTFVTINTDPLDTKVGSPPIVHQPQLSSLPGWLFLTGTIHQLNPIWKAYGVAIAVDETTHRVSHNDPLFFISPQGKLAWSANVFGDETARGHYTLPKAEIARYATGVAAYAKKLAAPR
ncbi:MAG TPA: SCO family protein [Acidimicrobiales bacterium]|nr:SCO family protein [Acidimicrobiales bacterium]